MKKSVENVVKKQPEKITQKQTPKKDEWTSLPVKQSTREMMSNLSKSKGMSMNDYLMFLADRAQRIVPSQIVLNVSGVEYGVAAQMTKILYDNNIIDSPSPERMMRFALFHLKESMEKEIERFQKTT